MRPIKILTLFLFFTLLTAACSGSNTAATAVPSNQDEVDTLKLEPTVVIPPDPTATTAPVEVDAPLLLANINNDLTGYTSYEVNVYMTVANQETGETSQFVEMQVQISADPPAQQISMRAQGVDEALGDEVLAIQMVTTDGQTYMDVPDMGCISLPSDGLDDTPFAEMLNAETFLSGLNNAQRVQPNETVNGVEAKHYVFDESFFSDLKVGDSITGHLWIDAADEHLVRLEMDGEGSGIAASLTGEQPIADDSIDRFTMTYDVSNINVPFGVIIPVSCADEAAGGGKIYPTLEDAYEQSSFSGIVTYKTAATVSDASTFYQNSLSAEGWNYNAGESFDAGALTTLAFNRDNAALSILIAPDPTGGDTTVTIMEE